MKSLSTYCEKIKVDKQVYTSWDQIPEEWNAMLPDAHHLSAEKLRLYEEAALPDLSFRYILLSINQKPAACFYFQILDFKRIHYKGNKELHRMFLHIEERILSYRHKIWVCGNFFRSDFPGFFFNPEIISAEQMFSSLALILKRGETQHKPSLSLLKDIPLVYADNAFFKRKGFRLFPEDVQMKMKLDPQWQTLEDYRKSLSKKYATRVLKTRESAKGLIRRELNLQEIDHYKERLDFLYRQVMQRQTIRLGILNAPYFACCKDCLKNGFRVFGYFLEEELVGFTTNFIKEDEWEVHYIGMDDEVAKTKKLYQQILLDGLEDAIAEGKSWLNLGRTAKEAKAILGCIPIESYNYYHIQDPIASLIFRVLRGRFAQSEGEEWKKRNPFK